MTVTESLELTTTELRRIRVRVGGGTHISALVGGSGPAVLLVHGLLDSAEGWQRIAQALLVDHTVIVPDLLGYGESDKPLDGDYGPLSHVVSFRRLLDELRIGTATVVGHSVGGALALAFAISEPQRCRALVLASSGGLGREMGMPIRVVVGVPGAGGVLWLVGTRPVSGFLKRVTRLAAGPKMADSVGGMLRMLADDGTRHATRMVMRSQTGFRGQYFDASSWVADMDMPVLVAWGEGDPLIPISHGHKVLERNAGARMVVYPKGGHFFIRRNAADFARRISALANGDSLDGERVETAAART